MTTNERRAKLTASTGKDYGQVEGGYGDLPLAEFLMPTEDYEGSLYLCAMHAKTEPNFGLAEAIDCDIICDECRNNFNTAIRGLHRHQRPCG